MCDQKDKYQNGKCLKENGLRAKKVSHSNSNNQCNLGVVLGGRGEGECWDLHDFFLEKTLATLIISMS